MFWCIDSAGKKEVGGGVNTAERCLFSIGVKYGKVVVRGQIAPNVTFDLGQCAGVWHHARCISMTCLCGAAGRVRASLWSRVQIMNVGEKDKGDWDKMCMTGQRNKIFLNEGFCWASEETFTPSYEMKQSVYERLLRLQRNSGKVHGEIVRLQLIVGL